MKYSERTTTGVLCTQDLTTERVGKFANWKRKAPIQQAVILHIRGHGANERLFLVTGVLVRRSVKSWAREGRGANKEISGIESCQRPIGGEPLSSTGSTTTNLTINLRSPEEH